VFTTRIQADIIQLNVDDDQFVRSTDRDVHGCTLVVVAADAYGAFAGRVDHAEAVIKDDVVCEDQPRTGIVPRLLEIPVHRVGGRRSAGQVRRRTAS